MDFCPFCGNLLNYKMPHMGPPARLACPTCPYVYAIDKPIKRKVPLVKKEIEPIFSKEDMKNAPKTEAPCPRCGHKEATFQQVQIRSADEPASIFYTCLNINCGETWRED